MLRQTLLRAGLAGSLLVPAAALRANTSADDSGPDVVVPVVAFSAQFDSRIVLLNHEPRTVSVGVRYVGERSSSSPGLRVCGKLGLPAAAATRPSITLYNPNDPSSPAPCKLNGPDDLGMMMFSTLDKSSPARISASGRVEVRDLSTGVIAQTLLPDGLPLGNLDGTDNAYVASGLRWDKGAPKPVTSDCFVGSFFDGSGFGGQVTRLQLKDRSGSPLGGPLLVAQKPFELVRVRDVFKLAGAPAGVYDDVRASFVFSGGGDTTFAYCWSEMRGPNRTSFAMNLAQVVEPLEESRKRMMSATLDTVPPPGVPMSISPSNTRVVHALYVRSPDFVNCSVGGGNGQLTIKAKSPDGFVTVGGSTTSTGVFASPSFSPVQANDAWGLEIAWAAGVTPTTSVTYTISCGSGNGTSLADEVFRN